ncbi:MAG TPA: hypothetical protein VIL35_17595 [Vicinamibacterales bacterium]
MACGSLPARVGLAVGLTACLMYAPTGRATAPGRLVGQVKLGIKPAVRPLPTADYGRQIAVPAVPADELTNVLVWLKDVPHGPRRPAPRHAELRQKGQTFVPHVVAVTTGSTVSFPNDDPIFHNVFSLSRAATFDLGRYRQGDTRERRFDRPGIVKVYCHLHAHMSAIVGVFDHAWFSGVGADGTFVIDDVPPGTHTLVGWHERAGLAEQTVHVTPGGTARVALLVPIEQP